MDLHVLLYCIYSYGNFSLKALGSTFSTSTPNLCGKCEGDGKKSEKLDSRRNQSEEEKIKPTTASDENQAENGYEAINNNEHLLTEWKF